MEQYYATHDVVVETVYFDACGVTSIMIEFVVKCKPLQPGGLPAKNVKIPETTRRRAKRAEGNPAAAE
jgi:hypothetical protein